jgi:outer membrane protein TolC
MKRYTTVSIFIWMGVLELAAIPMAFSQNEAPQITREAGVPTPISPSSVLSGGSARNPFFGGVPSGPAQPGVLPLSLTEVIDRGLKHNLGLLLAEQGTREFRGGRLRALSDLLPHLTTRTSETREQINLQAFGFPSFPGIRPIIGPFHVFDARAYLSQSILNLKDVNTARAGSENLKAAEYAYADARDLVVLVCADLYLEVIAEASRVEAARAQVNAAQALYDQAVDFRKAGMVPGIDILRAQVELEGQQQRLMFFQNEFQKQKLDLARVIGLPPGQQFDLTDQIPYAPLPALTLEQAFQQAYHDRADYQGAIARVHAAESEKRAARGEGLPSLDMNADYGAIGFEPGRSHGTFTLAANLRVPLFQGGRVHAEVLEADAILRQRQAELEDLRSRIDYEVRTAMLDLQSASERAHVAQSALDLAKEQVKQAQDRFAAGVVNSLEVVQAQEALATANENYISSLYAHNFAKASLARALGGAEEGVRKVLGGVK